MPALDPRTFDQTVRVQDDLYRHVNGPWLRTAEIPEDKPGTGAFLVLRDEAEAAVRDIITGLSTDGATPEAGTEAAKIADLFTSFMDTDAIEAAGTGVLAEDLAAVSAMRSTSALPRLLGHLTRRGLPSLVGVDVDADPGDPRRYVLFAGQGGLGLPDEEYYRADEYADIRAAYRGHIERSLALAGIEDAAGQAELAFALETEIAARHWDKVRTRDMRQMYNPMTLQEFADSAPELGLAELLASVGVPATASDVVNAQPSFFTDVASLVSDDHLPAWRAWARWKVVTGRSPYLGEAFVAERFAFYGTTLSGTPVLKERWKRGVDLVEGVLGEAVGKIYVERHFSPTAKERMDELVANLIEAYRRSITDLEWMTEATKAEALTKLGNFTPKIGYPDRWRDYSGLTVVPDDLLANVLASVAFDLDFQLAKIDQPIEQHEWFMTPQTVNAYYHPLRNEIVFPAAILQPPFFDETVDDAVNYGGIGAVIGHEIGHGFDDQGSTCDGEGRLRDWWTAADREAFEARTGSLIAQYDELSPEGASELHVNGALTIGENIGDLGGLSIALKAWRIATEGTEVPEIDGLTGEQRLFLSWATVWQSKMRPETVRQRIATDPHSPPEFRCNQIVRNVDDFYTAFDVTPTDALWLDESERVSIW
ncbi:M13 family metallopeptidase [Auraticoccus monumenti]|uniref:Putative endopeptidase n=1 Tax=Auraticoccus monumenti TaxID=675864 RepID=A0A1G6WW02_9ACTN|nr:M13-type metalloendopeptidase [Auraticoccus monumenti]SDD70130.1 putative endopeptidase [Auraticoccus monumenti]